MKSTYLSYEQRKKIEKLYNTGEDIKTIAEVINVHFTTIYREINRGSTNELDENGRFGYSSELSQRKFAESIKRRGTKKIK